MTICRELTKKFEEAVPTTLQGAVDYYEENTPRGEYVLVIAGADPEENRRRKEQDWQTLSLEEHMRIYEDRGCDRKEAMKKVAADRGVSKRDIYNALLPKEEPDYPV